SKNLHRRHLTRNQKRDVIAALLKIDPTQSDRAIAKQANTHGHAVAKVRKEEEANANISHKKERVEASGRKARGRKSGQWYQNAAAFTEAEQQRAKSPPILQVVPKPESVSSPLVDAWEQSSFTERTSFVERCFDEIVAAVDWVREMRS